MSTDRFPALSCQSQNAFLGTPPTNSLSVDRATNRVATWTYDAVGNVTNDGRHTYQYDADNRLIKVDGGTTATYEYGLGSERVLKTAAGVTTYYYWGVLEYENSAWTRHFIHGPISETICHLCRAFGARRP